MTKSKVAGTQVIERVFQILKCFSSQQKTLSLVEIVKITGLHPATTHRILQALTFQGAIHQESSTNRYRLGYGLVKLGDIARQSNDIYHVSQPYLQELLSVWGEAIVIDVPNSNHHMVTIILVPSTYRLGTTSGYDTPALPHATASGKAYLAYLPEKELKEILANDLPALTQHTITDENQLITELSLVREKGYATNHEEQELGLIAVAAPIFDAHDRVIAALSVGGPSHRMDEIRLIEIAESLVKTAGLISKGLGR